MRSECLNHKYVYGNPLQASCLVVDVADKHQRCTQSYVRRPYGVGLLVSPEDRHVSMMMLMMRLLCNHHYLHLPHQI